MKVFKLQRSQVLPINIDEAWGYFSNPMNLSQITPPGLSLKIKGRYEGKMMDGMLIQYSVKPLWGIEMDWVSEIKNVKEPFSFVDEQRVGPYRFWHHEHIFKPINKDKVEIMDNVHYSLPLGPFAALLNESIVENKLIGIFNYRKYTLEQKFGNGSFKGSNNRLLKTI